MELLRRCDADSQGSRKAARWRPWGIAVDESGDVYVSDTGNQRIQKFDREGNFITQWGGFGNADGHFNFPYGLSVDSWGNVLVVDSGNMRVQQFMPAQDADHQFKEEEVVAFLPEIAE